MQGKLYVINDQPSPLGRDVMSRATLSGCVVLVGAVVVFADACASLDPRAGLTTVDRLVVARTATPAYWSPGETPDRAISDTVSRLLTGPLSVEGAVRVAMLSNRELQARFEDLGVAQAEFVQAGLIANPLLTVSRITLRDTPGEMGIVQSFVSLLQRPARQRVAKAQLSATRVRVADAVVTHVTDVRSAYFALQAAQQMYELRGTVARATSASAQSAEAISAAGNLRDLDLFSEQAMAEESRAVVIAAQSDVTSARERLVRLMGVPTNDSAWTVSARLPDVPGDTLRADSLTALAVRRRLDLAATFEDITVAGRQLGLARRFALLADGSVGYDVESDGSRRSAGPTVSIPIPLFDQGIARTSAQRSRVRQAIARHDALAVLVRSEVRTAFAQLVAAQQRVNVYRTRVLPLRRRIVQETQLQFNAMTLGVFTLVQARQSEIEAGAAYVESIRDFWIARAALERATGGLLLATDLTRLER